MKRSEPKRDFSPRITRRHLLVASGTFGVLLGGAPIMCAAADEPSVNDVRTPMRRAVLGDIELEYEIRGEGTPVVLAHAGVLPDWFEPLMYEPALAERYRLVRYHRVGYAGSTRLTRPVSLAEQAAHLRALMKRLGIARAHIVGHSSSANIALQFALDNAEMVQSLALLEAALLDVPSGPKVAAHVLAPALERFRAGDRPGAVDTFLRGVAGTDYRAILDRVLPHAFEHAVADADTFFGQEMPAVRDWRFTRDDARRVTVPVLAVIGARSDDVRPVPGEPSHVFAERQERLLEWLPNAEPFVLPDATHLLQVQQPRALAEALATFFARHSIASNGGAAN
jgi:pimeloyl-ACP methyl ester carboxylesterase